MTEYNKNAKVATQNISDVTSFLATLKPGDTIWTSNVSHYTIQDTNLMERNAAHKVAKFGNKIKGPHILIVTMVDKKGTVKVIAPDFFHYKALYKARPRTYKELNL